MACMKLGMKKYYVGYWDLLGQKSAMRGVGENNVIVTPGVQKIINVTCSSLASSLASISKLYVKDAEKSGVCDVLRTNEPIVWGGAKDSEIQREFDRLECGIVQFSDSTLFYVSADSKLSMPILYYTCIVIGKLMPRLHACGLYPRVEEFQFLEPMD